MIEFQIDYFRITVHIRTFDCIDLYNEHFKNYLGPLSSLAHGAKGYKGVMASSMGCQLKHTPGADRIYCTYEFPGKACSVIPPEIFGLFYQVLKNSDIKFNVNRIDLAFDGVKFNPQKLYKVIIDDAYKVPSEKSIVRSLTQRENLELRSEPLKEKEDKSSAGRETCYFGSRYSERYLRLYNMRGPNRLEVEFKGDRAGIVAEDLFESDYSIDSLFEISISHLRDFIDIDLPWWHEFINEIDRAYAKLQDAKEVTYEKKMDWMLNQVAPSFAALHEIAGNEFIEELENEGRKRMHKNCSTLLSMYGKGNRYEHA